MSRRERTVEIRQWIRHGGMLVNAAALDWDDPNHPYNQIIAQGEKPEDFGYRHPLTKEFEGKTRDELIREIAALRKELEGWARADAMGVLRR